MKIVLGWGWSMQPGTWRPYVAAWDRVLASLVAVLAFGLGTAVGAQADTSTSGHVWRGAFGDSWPASGDSPSSACQAMADSFNSYFQNSPPYVATLVSVTPGVNAMMYSCIYNALHKGYPSPDADWSNQISAVVTLQGDCLPGYTLQQADGSCKSSPLSTPVQACAISHPVIPGTGVKILIERDEGSSTELPVTFAYRSQGVYGSAGGAGQWTLNWQRSLDTSFVRFSRPQIMALRDDGSGLVFIKSGTVWMASGTRDTLQPVTDATSRTTGWQYTVFDTNTVETYDSGGKLQSVRERNGRTTTLTYNSQNRLYQVIAPSGRSLTFAYDAQGRVSSITAPDGAVTKYAYNANGMLSSVTWPDNTVRQYVYEDSRFPTALTGVIDQAGVRYATYTYGDQGRAITSELTGGADRYQFQYQSNGQTTVLTPDGGSSVYSFLKQNGVLLPTGVSAPCPLCGSTSQSTDYDTSGNATRQVGYDGSATTYAYDALGRETQRVDGAGTADAKTTTTEWHPTWNLPVKATSPGKLETFAYDAVGNLVSYTTVATTDASGAAGFSATPTTDVVKTNWTYDSAGRVATASESTGSIASGTWTLTYDAQGNVQTFTDPDGRTANAVKYDAAGRLLEAVNTDAERVKYSYNARGLLLSYDVDGAIVNYDYDANGLLTAIRGPGDYYFGFKYDAAHRLIALLTPVGQATLASTANPLQAAKVAANKKAHHTAKLPMIEKLWITVKSWFSKLLGLLIGNATANPLLGETQVVPPIPAQVGGGIGGTSSGDPDLDTLQGISRPMPQRDPLLNEFIKKVRNITGTNQSTSEACEDDSRCQSAKQDASSLYWTLTQKRIPQYLSGGTQGHDAGHYKAIIERQNGLRKAIKKVKLYCRPLPAELPEWERVANQEIPILH